MEIVNGCSDMHDIPILSQLKEFKAIFLWKIFPYHRNFSPKLIKVPVLLFDTLEYILPLDSQTLLKIRFENPAFINIANCKIDSF